MKSIIGILANVEEKEFLPNSYMKQYSLNSSYVEAVRKSGGLPIILPIANNENIEEYISLIDGLLLVGGRDVNPILYNEELTDETRPVIFEKDKSDILYVKEMLKQNKPILGICRGMQIISVALGGSLCQDLNMCGLDNNEHFKLKQPYDEIHLVEIKENTILHNLFGNEIKVNSIHHQSVKKLGQDLIISAHAKDGTIEAIESTNENILAIQWHPELLIKGGNSEMLIIFKEFINRTK